MKSKLLVSIKSGLLLVCMLLSSIVMPLAKVQAAAANANNGNNGTLKIHEFGTPSGTESNDPKVCVFNLEGFDFDAGESGYITIEPQGGSTPVGVAAGPFSFGPTDANGYAETSPYFNAVGGSTIQDGTYKATLYGKDAGGNINLADEKAKSKVFKVECAGPVLTDVTPADVTFTDECGTANDTYTIPSTTGVLYQIAAVTVPAGTYPGAGTVTVTAVADAGFTLVGTTSWQHTFTDVACPLTVVTATAPTSMDLTCVADGSYTIPSTTGVIYRVNGTITAAGTYTVSTPGTITVTAEAAPGYQLTGQTTWTFVFTTPTNCGNTATDVCPNIQGLQAQVPVGFIIDQNGDCIVPGMGGGPTTPTPPVTPPQILAATTTTPSPAPSAQQLVNTGSSVLLNTFVGLFLLGSSCGIAILDRKFQHQ